MWWEWMLKSLILGFYWCFRDIILEVIFDHTESIMNPLKSTIPGRSEILHYGTSWTSHILLTRLMFFMEIAENHGWALNYMVCSGIRYVFTRSGISFTRTHSLCYTLDGWVHWGCPGLFWQVTYPHLFFFLPVNLITPPTSDSDVKWLCAKGCQALRSFRLRLKRLPSLMVKWHHPASFNSIWLDVYQATGSKSGPYVF